MENIKKYNAFISYRHKSLDMAIAVRLHRQIESFKLFWKLKNNSKNIRRVFRDRDELPTSNDLIKSIYDALDDSEYLIVLCSSSTAESEYVKREVEYFLQKSGPEKVIVLHIQDDLEAALPTPLKSLFESMKLGEPVKGFQIIDIRGKTDHDTLMLLKTEYMRIISILTGIDEAKLGENYFRKRLFSIIAVYVLFIALFFTFRGAYSNKFERAVELNDKLDTIAEEVKNTDLWSNYDMEKVMLCTQSITSQMLDSLQYVQGGTPVLKKVLMENQKVMDSLLEDTVSNELLYKIARTYGECARINGMSGDFEAAEKSFDKCFSVWDRIDHNDKRSSKEVFPASLFRIMNPSTEDNTDELATKADHEAMKSEHFRIAGVLYLNQKKWSSAYNYGMKAYTAIELTVKINQGKEEGFLSQKASVCSLVSSVLQILNRMDESEKYLLETLECHEKLKNSTNEPYWDLECLKDYCYLSCFYYQKNENVSADQYMLMARQKVSALAEFKGDNYDILSLALAYANMGDIYILRQDFKTAGEYYETALDICMGMSEQPDDVNRVLALGSSLLSLASIKSQEGLLGEAAKFNNRAFEVLNGIENQESNLTIKGLKFAYYNLCTTLAIRENNMKEAEIYLGNAEGFISDRYNKSDFWRLKSIFALHEKNLDKAMLYNENARKVVEDSQKENGAGASIKDKRDLALLELDHALILVYQGKPSEALTIINRVSKDIYESDETEFAVIEAFVCFEGGEFDKGMDILDRNQEKIIPGTNIIRYDTMETAINQPFTQILKAMLKADKEYSGENINIEKALKLLENY